MSEQNPPSGQPSPPPGEPEEPTQPIEGAGPTSSEEAAPPPPPPSDPAGTDEAAAPPPPPPVTKSRKPWIIGTAVVLVLLLIGGGIFAALQLTGGEDTHKITITSSAGGMKRDKAKETELKQQLDATAKQFQTQFKGTTGVKSALYNQDDTDRGPKGQLLFLGFKFTTPSEKNPTKFISQLNKIAASNQLKVTKVATGDAGGKAVCIGTASDSPQKNASCLWVTQDSAGALFPNIAGYDADHLSKIMKDLRADVETTD